MRQGAIALCLAASGVVFTPRGLATKRILPGLGLLAMIGAMALPAEAQAPASPSRPNPTTQAAYEVAIRCFIANGYGRRLKLDAGDTAAAALYEASAATSWEAAHVIAVSWRYPESRLTSDIDRARERELPALVRDPAYLRSTIATCRGLGLMPPA